VHEGSLSEAVFGKSSHCTTAFAVCSVQAASQLLPSHASAAKHLLPSVCCQASAAVHLVLTETHVWVQG